MKIRFHTNPARDDRPGIKYLSAVCLVALGGVLAMPAYAQVTDPTDCPDDAPDAQTGPDNLAVGCGADARGDGDSGNTAIGDKALASGPMDAAIRYSTFIVQRFEIDDQGVGQPAGWFWGIGAKAACLELVTRPDLCDEIIDGEEVQGTNPGDVFSDVQAVVDDLLADDLTVDYSSSDLSVASRNTAVGSGADARGRVSNNIAIGADANATGHGSAAEGKSTDNIAIGTGADANSAGPAASNASNIAIGRNADASGEGTSNLAIGDEASASNNGIAIGTGAVADGNADDTSGGYHIRIGSSSHTRVMIGSYDLSTFSQTAEQTANAIAVNAGLIGTNIKDISANRSKIAANSSAVSQLQSDVTHVDQRVSQIAAMAAALTSVPNAPANDGRFYFGVGFGNHAGESGYAVGVAGRLGSDRKLLINAAASSSGGETTVRAGMGWSF